MFPSYWFDSNNFKWFYFWRNSVIFWLPNGKSAFDPPTEASKIPDSSSYEVIKIFHVKDQTLLSGEWSNGFCSFNWISVPSKINICSNRVKACCCNSSEETICFRFLFVDKSNGFIGGNAIHPSIQFAFLPWIVQYFWKFLMNVFCSTSSASSWSRTIFLICQ